jgi:hypothetical protein
MPMALELRGRTALITRASIIPVDGGATAS